MPDADFRWRPTPDIRTFARIVNYVTEAVAHLHDADGDGVRREDGAERYRR